MLRIMFSERRNNTSNEGHNPRSLQSENRRTRIHRFLSFSRNETNGGRNRRNAMGNSHSQHHQIPFAQWAHSYPRPRHGQPQVKVLPERVPPLQLRTTDNGAILQNGGTISCRKQSTSQEERICRPRSSSAHRPPKLEDITLDKSRFGSEPDLRYHFKEGKDQLCENAVRQRISRSRKKYKAPPAPQNGTSSGMESSSPDLHQWESNEKERPGLPCRKGRLFKTRAETNKKNLTGVRAQGKVEASRSAEALDGVDLKSIEERARQNGDRAEKKRLKRSASQEVVSTKRSLATPEFQAELLQAAQRLRPSEPRNHRSPPAGKIGRCEARERRATPPGHDVPKENNSDSSGTALRIRDSEEKKSHRGEPLGSRGSEQRERNDRDVPFRKFYFGMKESDREMNVASGGACLNNVDKANVEHMLTAVEKSKNFMNLYKSAAERGQEWEETVDRFAASFQKAQMSMPNGNTTSCSSSFVSDPDEDVDGGIALQLRPTLPKKTLEIPRFSPTAAWRLLSSVDVVGSLAPSPGGSDDGPLLQEDGIRPPAPRQGLRSSLDKSGDSGISGDASPGGCQESSSEIAAASPKPATAQSNKSILMAWTPQQDLEEESSSEDFESPLDSSKNAICQIPGARFSPRGQLFVSRDQSSSLSVQRDDRLSLSAHLECGDFKDRNSSDLISGLNSLKKLKVALGSTKRNEAAEENGHSANENWVLSRSVPGSLNSGHVVATRSVSDPSSPEQDEEHGRQESLNYPSYSYLASGGRIMYLPEYHSRMSPDVSGIRPRNNMCNRFLSKSCENVTQHEMKQLGRSRSPSPMGARNRNEMGIRPDLPGSNPKKKKFTFQSTVRLLENRRIAERLSREAELKENQRLSELEAMKKVEEEFQKKRAREKANIRHQLRLFSLEEKNYSSLPTMDWEEGRGDSAPSSLPQVAQNHSTRKHSTGKKPSVADVGKFTPSTQILSEYKEPTRDYRDYRHSRFCEPQEYLSENGRSVVQHPRMVYDMPKNMPVYVSAPVNSCVQNQQKEEARVGMLTPRSTSSDNYRKDFAHGAPLNPGRPFTSSDSELSQSHAGSSGLASRRFAALHGHRSPSPEGLMPKTSPSQKFDLFGCPARRRSIGHNTVVAGEKSRSSTPPENAEQKKHDHSPLEKHLMKSTEPLEGISSHPEEPKTETLQRDGISDKHEYCGKAATDSLLRLGFPSLQPFNKEEKSFKPIKFNPVINKVAQIVT